MKYKIKTELIVKAMEDTRLEKRVRTVTLNSLRDSGLTRTETDNLTKEDAEFSLATIFIVSNQLGLNPMDVIEDLTLLRENLRLASESRKPQIFIGDDGELNPKHTLQGNHISKLFLLQPLSSDMIKMFYTQSEYQEPDFMLTKRELTEKMAYQKEKEQYSRHYEFLMDRPCPTNNTNIWISLIDPEIVTSESNKKSLKAFQADLAQYAELKNQEKTTSDTLEGLLGNAEVAVKAKKVDLKTVGEDYQIFYKTVSREVLISEEWVGEARHGYPNNRSNKRSYSFKYKPIVVDHFFIIAPVDAEAVMLDVSECKLEKHTLDMSDADSEEKWAENFWFTLWNEAGGIGPIEWDDDDPPF